MKKLVFMGILSIIASTISGCLSSKNPQNAALLKDKTSIHQFEFEDLEGKIISMSAYKGKKILIVNTASKCGFRYQLDDLEKLYQQYHEKLVVIAFPSSDFGNQEPLSNAEIGSFCQRNYGVSFVIAAKSHVKGKEINPIMEWLINCDKKGNIWWNFEKFLLDENGHLIRRFRSAVKPLSNKITSKI